MCCLSHACAIPQRSLPLQPISPSNPNPTYLCVLCASAIRIDLRLSSFVYRRVSRFTFHVSRFAFSPSCYNVAMTTNQPADLLDTLRELPPLLPMFLRKRRMGLPAVAEIAAELGVERPMLFTLLQMDTVQGSYGGEGITLAQLKAYEPYQVVDRLSEPVDHLIRAGLIHEGEDATLTLSPRAQDAVARLHSEAVRYLAGLQPLEAARLQQLAVEMERADAAVRANPAFAPTPGNHLDGHRWLARYGDPEARSAPLVRIEQAVLDLWGARDDAFTTAWRNAEFEGPALDVLSSIIEGHTTPDRLAEAMAARQTLGTIESCLRWLVEQEYIERDGDNLSVTPKGALAREDIERETNRVYFEGWPHRIDDATWLRDALRDLIRALPTS